MKFSVFFTLALYALCLVACRSRVGDHNVKTAIENSTEATTDSVVAKKASRVNVYIENSGSMNGYINGTTDFKTAMADLLVMLEYNYGKDSVLLHFINTGIHSIARPASSTTFAKELNTSNFRVGNVGSTNLNDIFKFILARTNPSTISLLLSDCIYSAKGNNAEHLLGIAKASTKGEFLQKSKRSSVGYTTTIVKLSSSFNGTYFDRYDKPHRHSGKRPYYLCVIGVADAMNDFNSIVPLKRGHLKGFENSYTLSSEKSNAKPPFWSVLPATYPARFIASKGNSTNTYIHGIENVEIDTRDGGIFELRLAVDMSGYDVVDESYLLSPANYEVKNGDFSITQIAPIDQVQLMQNDKLYTKSATHIIYLEANSTAYSDIEIELKNQIPQWVYQTNVDEDTRGVADDQTFGIKYMVEGIAEAYDVQNSSDNYFTISIPIQKSHGTSMLTILFIVIGGGALAYFCMKIYKRNH